MAGTLDGIEAQRLTRMYRDILRIRMVEETIAERYAEQEMRCPVHLSIGQEASAVGVAHALRHSDRAFSTHRCHSHYLAMGCDLQAMLAEIYGKAAGCLGGRGGSMHLADRDKGLIASVPVVASSIPLAVGTALADSIDGNDNVSVAFFGEACVEEGVFHESANFSGLRKLPVLFVCENNLFSVYTPLAERQPPRPIADVARAHALNFVSADGNDVVAVFAAAQAAVERARKGGGPTFLLLDTYRWREHCGPGYDNHLGYRTEAEFEEWRRRCPLERHLKTLRGQSLLPGDSEESMRLEIRREIDAAFEFAKNARLPEPSDARKHVYA